MAQSSPNKNRLLEKYIQVVREDGLQTNKNVNIGINGNSASLWVSGSITAGGAITQSGVIPTVYHSGQIGVVATTALFQLKLVTTESYYSEVFIPANTTITGISVLNGHTTSASGNINVGLANSAGTVVASSATNVAQGAADLYQQIPFSAAYSATGPAKYFIVVQGSQTTGYIAAFNTTGTQNFGAAKKTSETYGTFVAASYATTTYTQQLGPVADTY